MKTATTDLLKNDLLIIELPEGGDYTLYDDMLYVWDDETDNHKRFKGSYTLLGKPDEIKEEDAKELVRSGSYTTTFWNHKTNDNHKSNQLKTATESLLSAIETVVFWENQKTFGDFLYSPKEWEAVERNTFDRNRTLIFVKN